MDKTARLNFKADAIMEQLEKLDIVEAEALTWARDSFDAFVEKIVVIATRLKLQYIPLSALDSDLRMIPNGEFRLDNKKLSFDEVVSRWGAGPLMDAVDKALDALSSHIQSKQADYEAVLAHRDAKRKGAD